jgi:hypothetical protein
VNANGEVADRVSDIIFRNITINNPIVSWYAITIFKADRVTFDGITLNGLGIQPLIYKDDCTEVVGEATIVVNS